MSSMEYVEPTNEEKNKNLLAGKTVVLEDFSSGVAGTPSYTIRYNSGGKQALLVFEPNDKLIHAMWRCAPGKVQVRR